MLRVLATDEALGEGSTKARRLVEGLLMTDLAWRGPMRPAPTMIMLIMVFTGFRLQLREE